MLSVLLTHQCAGHHAYFTKVFTESEALMTDLIGHDRLATLQSNLSFLKSKTKVLKSLDDKISDLLCQENVAEADFLTEKVRDNDILHQNLDRIFSIESFIKCHMPDAALHVTGNSPDTHSTWNQSPSQSYIQEKTSRLPKLDLVCCAVQLKTESVISDHLMYLTNKYLINCRQNLVTIRESGMRILSP